MDANNSQSSGLPCVFSLLAAEPLQNIENVPDLEEKNINSDSKIQSQFTDFDYQGLLDFLSSDESPSNCAPAQLKNIGSGRYSNISKEQQLSRVSEMSKSENHQNSNRRTKSKTPLGIKEVIILPNNYFAEFNEAKKRKALNNKFEEKQPLDSLNSNKSDNRGNPHKESN